MSAKTGGRITKQEIKQDQFVSWMFYLTELLQKNKRMVLGVVGGVAAVVIIIMLIANHQQSLETEAQELFGRASVEMRSGGISLAIIDFRKIINEHGSSEIAGLSCFYLANAYFTQRDFNEAENLYRRYLADYGDDPLMTISAHWGIGGCLEQKAEFGAASDEYYQAAQMNPTGSLAADLLFSSVRTACEAADSSRAVRAYQMLDEYLADQPQAIDPARLYLYEHGYLAPPME